MRKLGRCIERVIAGRRLVLRQCRPRFHCVGHQSVIDEIDLGDVMGSRKGGVGRRCIADRPIATEIAWDILIELRCAGHHCRDDFGHRRQNAVMDVNALGSVASGFDAISDDHRHRIADVAHLALRQQRVRRLLHRRAVLPRDAPGAWHAIKLVLRDVLAGEDRSNAGARQRLDLFDRDDFCMSVGRAQEYGMKLVRQHNVMDIAPATGEEAPIFASAKWYPDPIFGHCDLRKRRSLGLPRAMRSG